MTVLTRISSIAHVQHAQSSNPIPPENRTVTADVAIRAALALMPFSAIAWLFIAH